MASILLYGTWFLCISLAWGEGEADDQGLIPAKKIVIHVPYKIQHHHHTRTKYKILTVPEHKHNEVKAELDHLGLQYEDHQGLHALKQDPYLAATTEKAIELTHHYDESKLPKKYYLRVKQPKYPILDYLGLGALTKLWSDEDEAAKKVQLVHQEPKVEHIIHDAKFSKPVVVSYSATEEGDTGSKYVKPAYDSYSVQQDNFGHKEHKFGLEDHVSTDHKYNSEISFKTGDVTSETQFSVYHPELNKPSDSYQIKEEPEQRELYPPLYTPTESFGEHKSGFAPDYYTQFQQKSAEAAQIDPSHLIIADRSTPMDPTKYQKVGYLLVGGQQGSKLVLLDQDGTTRVDTTAQSIQSEVPSPT